MATYLLCTLNYFERVRILTMIENTCAVLQILSGTTSVLHQVGLNLTCYLRNKVSDYDEWIL